MGFATRKFLALALLIATYYLQVPAEAAEPVTACAIRWDAWYTNGLTDPGRFAADTLGPARWHHLAPLHARFDASGKITWEGSQQNFDAEIRAADSASFCWAYVMYGTKNVIDLANPLMRGLVYHRSSTIGSDVKYTMMVPSNLLGEADKYEVAVKTIVSLVQDPNYQRVSIKGTSRPLLFLLYDPVDLKHFFGGSLAKLKDVIEAIRAASSARRLGDPYIVIVFSPANKAETIRQALGADGISEYVAGKRKGGMQTWAEFEPTIEADWDGYVKATSADAIPTLRSGADIRARCETPPPFDHRFAERNCDSYVLNPSVQELRSEFQNSVAWVGSHSDRDPAHLLLVYSWSECDESGNCLMPTVGDPSGRKLKAISGILGPPTQVP